MAVPHITRFCWCMSLETGTKAIGFLHLIISLTFMVVCSLFAAKAKTFVGTVEDADDHLYSTWYTIALIVAVISVVHVLLAATLIVAAFKRNTDGLRAWVWVMAALLVVSLGFNLVVSIMSGFSSTGSDIFLSFLEALVIFGTVAYCILAVYNYYLMLKSSETMTGPDCH